MSDRRFRVLAIASHAVQYAAPIFRLMAQHPQLDFHVAYCGMRGAEAGHDPEFGHSVKWDVPLLDGYAWTHVPNRGSGTESRHGHDYPRSSGRSHVETSNQTVRLAIPLSTGRPSDRAFLWHA